MVSETQLEEAAQQQAAQQLQAEEAAQQLLAEEAARRSMLEGGDGKAFKALAHEAIASLDAGRKDAQRASVDAQSVQADAADAASQLQASEGRERDLQKSLLLFAQANESLQQRLDSELTVHASTTDRRTSAETELERARQAMRWLRGDSRAAAAAGGHWDLEASAALCEGGEWSAEAAATVWQPREVELEGDAVTQRAALVAALPFPREGASTCRLRLRRGASVRLGLAGQSPQMSKVLTTEPPLAGADDAACRIEVDISYDTATGALSWESADTLPAILAKFAPGAAAAHLTVALLPAEKAESDLFDEDIPEELRCVEWLSSFGGIGRLRSAAQAEEVLRAQLETAVCERKAMAEALRKAQADAAALEVDKARLKRSAASAAAKAQQVMEGELLKLRRELEAAREEQETAEMAFAGMTAERDTLTAEVTELRAERLALRASLSATKAELAERPDLGMVVSAVQTAQAQTCDTVRAEAEALTKALPRVRAVQAVATERAQAHQQTARTPTAPARGSGASTIEAETAAAISAAVSAKAAGMGDDQAVAAAAAAAAAAEEALARGAVVFPVRSTVGLAAVDSRLQASLRRNMGEQLFQQYVGALTTVDGTGPGMSPSPPSSAPGERRPGGRADWWRSMPGELEPWSGDKAVDAARAGGLKPTDSPRQRPGEGLHSLTDWLETYFFAKYFS